MIYCLNYPETLLIKMNLTCKEEKTDINLLQDVYIPKSLDDFNNILNKFCNGDSGNKIDISKYLLVKKYT